LCIAVHPNEQCNIQGDNAEHDEDEKPAAGKASAPCSSSAGNIVICLRQ